MQTIENSENETSENNPSQLDSKITESAPKKRGRPAGYRKSKDGTWIKPTSDNAELQPAPSIRKKAKKKKDVAKILNTKKSEDISQLSDEPSDEELAAIEAEDIDNVVSKEEELSSSARNFIIRRVVPNYEEYARNISYVNRQAVLPVVDSFLHDFIITKSPTFGDVFDLFRNNMAMESSSPLINYSDDDMDEFITYLFNQCEILGNNGGLSGHRDSNAVNLYQVQYRASGEILGYIFPIYSYDNILRLKNIDPFGEAITFNPFHKLSRFQGLSFGCMYPARDIKHTSSFRPCYVEQVEFAKGTGDDYAKIYKFDLLIPSMNQSYEFVFDVRHAPIELNARSLEMSYEDDIDSEIADQDDYDESFEEGDEDNAEVADVSSEEPGYLVDRKYDESYQEECDHLLEKSIRESNKGRLPSYDEIFYPGTTRDRREFDSLDNGNYYHRDTGLAGEWNPDDF